MRRGRAGRGSATRPGRDRRQCAGGRGGVPDWLAALAAHDAAAACALQAPEFTIELRLEAILEDRAELGDPCTGFEALLWEDPSFDSEVVEIDVTQQTDEDALLEVHLASQDLTVRMVYHRARWRVSSTADRSDSGDSGDRLRPGALGGAWCGLSPDQTREQIVALMGEPSGEYTVSDGGEPQLWWAKDQYDFRVYLDPLIQMARSSSWSATTTHSARTTERSSPAPS